MSLLKGGVMATSRYYLFMHHTILNNQGLVSWSDSSVSSVKERTSENRDVVNGVFSESDLAKWLYTKGTHSTILSIDEVCDYLNSIGCTINDPLSIKSFLTAHQNIVQYLKQAPEVILSFFNGANLNLELYFDPEIDNDEGELFLNIETSLEVEEASSKLDEIDDKWLLEINDVDMARFNLRLVFI